jgi:hypothetical protein
MTDETIAAIEERLARATLDEQVRQDIVALLAELKRLRAKRYPGWQRRTP